MQRPITHITKVSFLAALALLLGALIIIDLSGSGIRTYMDRFSGSQNGSVEADENDFHCVDRGIESLPCYRAYYAHVVLTLGVTAAFDDLKARYAVSPFVEGQCHQLTHEIGHAALIFYKTPSQAFIHGDALCWSGYYHGVMEETVGKIDVIALPETLNTICSDIQGKEKYSFDYYNCVHGLGHGVMTSAQDNLFGSLSLCGKLEGAWERSACAGGVFMENVMVELRSGNADFKQEDPAYPCTAVSEEYKAQCFLMQTSHMLHVTNRDFKKVFALCASADPVYQTLCYEGIGREASGGSISDAEKTRALCAQGASDTERSHCILGAVKDFVSYFHSDMQAKDLCTALSAKERAVCLSTVESYYRSF